jgi:hypothetical protein
MAETVARRCGAELHHAHGTAVCDLPDGHSGLHEALCDTCREDGYDDPSDRLEWERDGENWLTRKTTPAAAPSDPGRGKG